MRNTQVLVLLVLLFVPAFALAADGNVSIVSSGPNGEIASLAEANEIRVVFSEPMVSLGKIPDTVQASFVKIAPAIRGSFRWSGTTILIFTPDPAKALPFATKYSVTVDTTAKSAAGHTLAEPYSFSFTTPTVKLLSTGWYRKGERFDGGVVIGMRFNQPVKPAEIAKHLVLRHQAHDWTPPTLPASGIEWLKKNDPDSLAKFDTKVAKTKEAVAATSPVMNFLPDDWDKGLSSFTPGNDLVVVETRPGVPTESWVQLVLDEKLPSTQGKETPGKTQDYVVRLEHTLFIRGTECVSGCDPDRWNPIRFEARVRGENASKFLKVEDITKAAQAKAINRNPKPRTDENYSPDVADWLTLEEAGFGAQPPASTWRITADPAMTSDDGQTLGYRWVGTIENWHRCAFQSFGDGHGVWESGGGTILPFYSRNVKDVNQWASPLTTESLMPTILDLQEDSYFRMAPDSEPVHRKLGAKADAIQSHGLDLAPALGTSKSGLVWAAVEMGEVIAKSNACSDESVRSTILQVTNLGIHIKDSPVNTLIFVTRLDDGKPVSGASVSIRTRDNKVFWTGTTDASGLAVAPDTALRTDDDYWKLTFIVTAEKDGDTAYVGSDWNEGIDAWEFGLDWSLESAKPLLRGTIFSDRGVYKPGEEVHFKAVLRNDTAKGIRLFPAGTKITLRLLDSQAQELDTREVMLSEWSSAEWTFTLPQAAALGNYTVIANLAGAAKEKEQQTEEDREYGTPPEGKEINGNFLVATYRRPDFRVDATLSGTTAIAGDKLDGKIAARYLFGGSMSERDVKWKFTSIPVRVVPAPILNKFPEELWSFLSYSSERASETELASNEETLDRKGDLPKSLDTKIDAGVPMRYTFEGDVTDVSRQHIANRASLVVHPAPWYIGVKTAPYFIDQKSGLDTQLVAVSPEGLATAGVKVSVKLVQKQWSSVRRAEGNGFYTWDWEEKSIDSGNWEVTTAATPAPLHIPFQNGGYYVLTATATDAGGRFTTTENGFYVLGAGYTAWQRYDHNRIDLVPEKKHYKPGEVARIMIKSPWETATALLTTEREGVRTQKQFDLTSTQQTITVPVTEADIPNVFVSVLLVKGRTKVPTAEDDASDPGKPSFRLGYTELTVEDATKRLKVDVKSNQPEYRPANSAKITINVRDQQGKPVESEVTLWAVDYGVLSLTNYKTPEILGSVYMRKSLSVRSEDSRERIVSRRVLTPKGGDEGGGGGEDEAVGTIRKDFRILAFWLGSVKTDKKGNASIDTKLPESLTTYRIMAVASDKVNRFGSGETEIKINKPVLLRQNFPRFLAPGDKAFFGSIINSQMKKGGQAVVAMESLDPSVLTVDGDAKQTVEIDAMGTREVRFPVTVRGIGEARVRMSVRLLGESDAFEDKVPVRLLTPTETVAAYGQAKPDAQETVELPKDVRPDVGGLNLELSSTAMVGLGEGARYLVDYPYGCAEQRASSANALMVAGDLGDAFKLPGVKPEEIHGVAQKTLTELETFQCGDGGFVYWPGGCPWTSPYLTSYVLHVYQRGAKLGYTVNEDVLKRGYDYLEAQLAQQPPTNEGWWPSYTAWQSYAIKVLAEGGRNQDSNFNRLYGYLDRMPVFAISYLYDALKAKGETSGPRVTELRRRMFNSILPEGGSAHVEELADPYLLWFWNSNIRSTSIVLGSLVRNSDDQTNVASTVRWLMNARKKGRWGNTQENALAMEALVDYYKKYESEIPDFTAVVTLGADEIQREPFKGRSTAAKASTLPMKSLLAKGETGAKLPLSFKRDGTAGTLFYIARLKYASMTLPTGSTDKGFRVQRKYALDAEPDKATTSFDAGDLVRVTLTFNLPKERRFVAVTDPLPGGLEPVEAWFATTASDLRKEQRYEDAEERDWTTMFRRGGFDHIERHDDRVNLFATRLSEGQQVFTYLARATTAGTFNVAPTQIEEMYEPEVFGRSKGDIVEVKP